ncbi:WXG100 family type VII secretion target [Nocardia pseudobrasiliensis]|uniref:PPE family protein n=1 Tax=Nocardia pseudobrasiliensis TaxID=45979 RepID=A0A370I2T3_9NOCA|nr:hypothetical protein [Nocardia pseudobrasiliensis]RDI65048.1 hypothetical protein DFR76_107426 [Nocardia pseudobrasiliensis]
MSSYEDYQRRIIAAQDQWNKERERIYGETRTFDSAFQGDFDKPAINYCEVYEGYKLDEMRKIVSEMRPDEVRDASEIWRQIGKDLEEASKTFNTAFAKTVSGDGQHAGWTGQSGPAAVTAVNNYTTQSQNLVAAAQVVGAKLAEAHTGLEQTQALFPGITQRPNVLDKTLPKDGVMKSGDYDEEEETEEARRILRTVYGRVVVQTDQGVPVLPTPQPITDSGPIAPVPNQPWPGGSTPGGTNTGNTGNTTSGGETPSGETKPEDSKDQGGETKPDDNSAEDPGTQAASTSPSSLADSGTTGGTSGVNSTSSGTATTPAGLGGASSTGGITTPGIGRGGSSGGGGLGRGGSGGGTGGQGTAGNAPGRSIPGGGLAPTAAAAARLAGASGQAGTAGLPGMGMPGAGAKKEEDREKSGVPDYLVTQEHGEELIGPDTKAIPPVIGGDYDRD